MRFLIFLTTFIAMQSAALAECLSPYSALVFTPKDGKIIFEKRADKFVYPASLVKIMTLYLTFEALDSGKLELKQKLTFDENALEIAQINKKNLNLYLFDQITVEDAIKASIVKSFNEASFMLAIAIAGDEWSFADLMNKKAKELKMHNTNFRNATGLHEPGQYTTVYDMARLMMAFEKNFTKYRHYFALKKFNLNEQEFKSHNYVLLEYKGSDGFKTGFTSASGFNLIASATRKNTRIDTILVGCEGQKIRDEYTKKLLDEGFEKNEKFKGELVMYVK